MIDLALQIVLVLLLVLTITWCVIVHQRLRRLRTDRGELQEFIAALSDATGRAEVAIRQMREAGQEAVSGAVDQQRLARERSAELARLIDNAVRVIKRLDAAREQGAARMAELRTRADASQRPTPPPAEAAAPAAQRPSRPPIVAERRPDRRAERHDEPPGRTGQLDGLLHGELLQALQALR